MKNIQEQLRAQVTECETIRDQAIDRKKRELFGKFADHDKVLVAEIERAM